MCTHTFSTPLGCSIPMEALQEFESVTGASVDLTDYSVPSLADDYDPHDLDYFMRTYNKN